jgi:hypothetical protein
MDFLAAISEPAVREAAQHFVDHVASSGGDLVGREGAKLLAERALRFIRAKLGWEAPETIAVAVGRLQTLYEELYARLGELEKTGRVTADSARSAFQDPQGAATMSAACETVIETNDVDTIGALARLLASRATAPPSSRLALRTREAAEATRNLQPRQLVILAQAVLANMVPAPSGMVPGDPNTPVEQRIAAFDAWVSDALRCVEGVTPRFDDMLQLEASRLLVLSSRAEGYEERTPPHGSAVANKLMMISGSPYSITRAMSLLGDLQLGTDRGERAHERAALGAYYITDAGLLLGYLVLQQRGMTALGVNFETWSADAGTV